MEHWREDPLAAPAAAAAVKILGVVDEQEGKGEEQEKVEDEDEEFLKEGIFIY